MKKGIIITIVVLLLVYVATYNKKEEELVIAGLFAQTGYASFVGENSTNGFIMAIEDAGLDPDDFPVEDFQSDIKTTLSAARKLITVDNADIIIGPEWSEFSLAVTPVAEETQTLFISPWLSSDREWVETKYLFSGTPSTRHHVIALVQHAVEQDITDVAVINTNNPWANEYTEVVLEEIEKANLNIAYRSQNNPGDRDFRTTILGVKESGPEIVFAILGADVGIEVFHKQYGEIGYDAEVYMPFSTGKLSHDTVPELAQGVVYPATKEYGRSAEFNKKYKARFGVEPTAISAATTYDMTTLVLAAIDNGAKDTEDVIEYLQNVKEYEGYSNVITFNELGLVAEEEVEIVVVE